MFLVVGCRESGEVQDPWALGPKGNIIASSIELSTPVKAKGSQRVGATLKADALTQFANRLIALFGEDGLSVT